MSEDRDTKYLHERLNPYSDDHDPQPPTFSKTLWVLWTVIGLLCLNSVLLIAVLARQDVHDTAGQSCQASQASQASQTYGDAACASMCAPVCVTVSGTTCYDTCYNSCTRNKGITRPSEMGSWLLLNSVQHVGLTTSNLSRSVAFYTDMLGGVEVIGAGGDGWKGDEVYQLLMQAALIRGGEAASWAANLSAAGPDTMSARYIQLGNVVLELLDYKTAEAQLQQRLRSGRRRSTAESIRQFPAFSNSTVAPSVAGNMHISFNIRMGKNLNEFVAEFVSRSHARGYSNVYCDRLVPVPVGSDGMGNVSGVPLEDNSYYVDSGTFEGWSLAYCKGPDGEQLEFNQVSKLAESEFNQALQSYLNEAESPIWNPSR